MSTATKEKTVQARYQLPLDLFFAVKRLALDESKLGKRKTASDLVRKFVADGLERHDAESRVSA